MINYMCADCRHMETTMNEFIALELLAILMNMIICSFLGFVIYQLSRITHTIFRTEEQLFLDKLFQHYRIPLVNFNDSAKYRGLVLILLILFIGFLIVGEVILIQETCMKAIVVYSTMKD